MPCTRLSLAVPAHACQIPRVDISAHPRLTVEYVDDGYILVEAQDPVSSVDD